MSGRLPWYIHESLDLREPYGLENTLAERSMPMHSRTPSAKISRQAASHTEMQFVKISEPIDHVKHGTLATIEFSIKYWSERTFFTVMVFFKYRVYEPSHINEIFDGEDNANFRALLSTLGQLPTQEGISHHFYPDETKVLSMPKVGVSAEAEVFVRVLSETEVTYN